MHSVQRPSSHCGHQTSDGLEIWRQNRMTNSNDVKDQKRQIENEIKELRTKINTHLDKLQENLMKELTEADKHVSL
jgi:gas vesicle protein